MVEFAARCKELVRMKKYDAIIVGAGHNGLIASCYLARAGKNVLVLERRHVIGGATVTEEVVPGFKFSRLAYVNSLFRPEIIRELRLKSYGFQLLPRNPSSFTPFPDGQYLFMGPDLETTKREIAKFSTKDAEAFPRYEKMLEKLVTVIEPTLDQTPQDPLSSDIRSWLQLIKLGLRARRLGKDFYRLATMLTGPASALLDEWFESEELKVTLATDAIIGAMASPSSQGTAYVLFHHVMGETNGARGVWSYVRGGMGALSGAIAEAARDMGVEWRTECPVSEIVIENGSVQGVITEAGEEIRAGIVLSNADPKVTFTKLVPRDKLPEDFARRIESLDFSSATFKLNLALSELPDFKALPGNAGTFNCRFKSCCNFSSGIRVILASERSRLLNCITRGILNILTLYSFRFCCRSFSASIFFSRRTSRESATKTTPSAPRKTNFRVEA